MEIKLSLLKTAPTPPPRKRKPSRESIEEVRFWKTVALSLAVTILGLIFSILIAVLLK